MKLARRPVGLAALAVLALSTAACGNDEGAAASSSDAPASLDRLTLVAPAAPGGGWDSTARTMQQVLEQEGLVESAQTTNVPGAGGTIGLAGLASDKGKAGTLMTMGLVMVGAVETNKSQVTLDDVTPIARLTSEQEAVVVPAESEYQTLDDLVADWKSDPGSVAIAGGSAGGTDQIFAGLLAEAAGIDPKKVNYVPFSGGGEALAAILGGKVSAGISGVSEFQDQVAAGKLRALAVSGAEPVEGFDAPTATEAGLDVELENWRGVVAPAGLSDADVDALSAAVQKMYESPAWKAELAENGWDDAYLPAEEFATYLDAEQERVRAVLTKLGLV